MNLDNLIAQVLAITSTFNLKISIILFLLCAIGEVGFALPYILETIWLMAGYQLSQGNLSTLDVLYIWLIAQAGRQTGNVALYYSGMLGMIPLRKLYRKYIQPRLPKRQILPASFVRHITNPSPFSIAVSRLVGLRIPAAVTMGARHQLSYLSIGVLLSSIVWDGVYLVLGYTVGNVLPNPINMFWYSVGGLTGIYLLTVGIRYLLRLRRTQKKTNNEPAQS
jgi:membrane protein DedA with SNARE-associated domain